MPKQEIERRWYAVPAHIPAGGQLPSFAFEAGHKSADAALKAGKTEAPSMVIAIDFDGAERRAKVAGALERVINTLDDAECDVGCTCDTVQSALGIDSKKYETQLMRLDDTATRISDDIAVVRSEVESIMQDYDE